MDWVKIWKRGLDIDVYNGTSSHTHRELLPELTTLWQYHWSAVFACEKALSQNGFNLSSATKSSSDSFRILSSMTTASMSCSVFIFRSKATMSLSMKPCGLKLNKFFDFTLPSIILVLFDPRRSKRLRREVRLLCTIRICSLRLQYLFTVNPKGQVCAFYCPAFRIHVQKSQNLVSESKYSHTVGSQLRCDLYDIWCCHKHYHHLRCLLLCYYLIGHHHYCFWQMKTFLREPLDLNTTSNKQLRRWTTWVPFTPKAAVDKDKVFGSQGFTFLTIVFMLLIISWRIEMKMNQILNVLTITIITKRETY